MQESITLKASCYIPDDTENPRLLFLENTSKKPILFKHTLPDGPAHEQHLITQTMGLIRDFENLASGESYIEFSGTCEYNGEIFLMHWDENFHCRVVLTYDTESDSTDSPNRQNYRTDCRNMIPEFKTMGLTCKLDNQEITPAKCNECTKYDPRYIQFPTVIAGIKTTTCAPDYTFAAGTPVAIRPSDSEKTYLGIYLGELPMALGATLNRVNHVLTNTAIKNPAFWVFDLEKIVFGAESWWKKIDSPNDLKAITDTDIEHQLYKKLLEDLEK